MAHLAGRGKTPADHEFLDSEVVISVRISELKGVESGCAMPFTD
jgi:hypothetical protein